MNFGGGFAVEGMRAGGIAHVDSVFSVNFGGIPTASGAYDLQFSASDGGPEVTQRLRIEAILPVEMATVIEEPSAGNDFGATIATNGILTVTSDSGDGKIYVYRTDGCDGTTFGNPGCEEMATLDLPEDNYPTDVRLLGTRLLVGNQSNTQVWGRIFEIGGCNGTLPPFEGCEEIAALEHGRNPDEVFIQGMDFSAERAVAIIGEISGGVKSIEIFNISQCASVAFGDPGCGSIELFASPSGTGEVVEPMVDGTRIILSAYEANEIHVFETAACEGANLGDSGCEQLAHILWEGSAEGFGSIVAYDNGQLIVPISSFSLDYEDKLGVAAYGDFVAIYALGGCNGSNWGSPACGLVGDLFATMRTGPVNPAPQAVRVGDHYVTVESASASSNSIKVHEVGQCGAVQSFQPGCRMTHHFSFPKGNMSPTISAAMNSSGLHIVASEGRTSGTPSIWVETLPLD